MGEVQAFAGQPSTGAVIPFPGSARRASRLALRADEPRGEILLFTGVRYERSFGSDAPPASSGESKAGGRRRRRS